MVRYFGRGWYVAIFIAMIGFATGAALDGDYRYVSSAIYATGNMQGAELMTLSLQSVLFNLILVFLGGLFIQRALERIISVLVICVKAVVMGLCCKGLMQGCANIAGIIISAVTLLGGLSICAAILLLHSPRIVQDEYTNHRLRVYFCTAGILAEGVLVPSLAKSLSMLMN